MLQGKSCRSYLIAAVLAVLLPAWGTAAAEPPPLAGVFAERFTLLEPRESAPETAFRDRDGDPVRLSDFRGRVVLVNFWATWCAPCVEEMPTLDALTASLGREGLKVLAVSQDVGGREAVEPFLRERLELENLEVFLDPKGELSRAMGVRGLPTTFLIDARGRIVGALEGPADWNGAPARELIRHYIDEARAAGVVDTAG